MAAKRRRTIEFPVFDAGSVESQRAAGNELLFELQRLYCVGRLEATSFCSLVHLAARAGARIDQSWGLRPDDPSRGHYQRVIDDKLSSAGLAQTSPLVLSIPGTGSSTHMRHDMKLHVRPFHELLHREIGSSLDRARGKFESRTWPRAYWDHPVVRGAPAGTFVVPLGLFVDAARYGGQASSSKNRSVLVMSLVNLVTGRRRASLLLRKHLACKCGCRGYCTFSRAFVYAHWCASALADGVFPEFGVDRDAHNDGYRSSLALRNMGYRGAIVQLQLDWEGLCQMFNVPPWMHKTHPCPLCNATSANRHDYRPAL
eukprot:1906552-Pyramimonas_sp.AAC.1